MTTRRELLIALGAGALAWAGAVRAQAPAKVRRIGFLSGFSPSDIVPWQQAFRLGLRDLGWVEGKNISIEYRFAEGKADRLPELAADLVRLKVDIIVAGSTTEAPAAQKPTKTIPIVFAAAGDPVASGLVESLARPGGNLTGLSLMSIEMVGKRLELLKEMVPKLSRVAVLWNPQAPTSILSWKELQLLARQRGLQFQKGNSPEKLPSHGVPLLPPTIRTPRPCVQCIVCCRRSLSRGRRGAPARPPDARRYRPGHHARRG